MKIVGDEALKQGRCHSETNAASHDDQRGEDAQLARAHDAALRVAVWS